MCDSDYTIHPLHPVNESPQSIVWVFPEYDFTIFSGFTVTHLQSSTDRVPVDWVLAEYMASNQGEVGSIYSVKKCVVLI